MRKLFLTNRFGRTYILNDVYSQHGVTSIRFAGKQVSVRASLDDMKAAWEKWNEGAKCQDAFPFLSQLEREFLITGFIPRDLKAS